MSTRPNDLVIDKKDGIYFTLPSDKPSAVYYIPAGGQATKVAEAPGAHGIQLSPDEKTLYSADSGGEYLIAFDVQPDGKLTNRRNFGKYTGSRKAPRATPTASPSTARGASTWGSKRACRCSARKARASG